MNIYLQLLIVTSLAYVVVVADVVIEDKQHSTSELKLKKTELKANINLNKIIQVSYFFMYCLRNEKEIYLNFSLNDIFKYKNRSF